MRTSGPTYSTWLRSAFSSPVFPGLENVSLVRGCSVEVHLAEFGLSYEPLNRAVWWSALDLDGALQYQ